MTSSSRSPSYMTSNNDLALPPFIAPTPRATVSGSGSTSGFATPTKSRTAVTSNHQSGFASSASSKFASSSSSRLNSSSISRPRLQSLYADFSAQKQSNPASYAANVNWWARTLGRYVRGGWAGYAERREVGWDGREYSLSGKGKARAKDRLVLEANATLIEDFRVDGVGKPICFGCVLTELSSPPTPSLILLPSFLSSSSPILSLSSSSSSSSHLSSSSPPTPTRSKLGYASAAASLLTAPLWWGLEQVGVIGEDSLASSISSALPSLPGFAGGGGTADTRWYGEYVFLPLLEHAAERVIHTQERRMMGVKDALYTFDQFRNVFGVALSSGDEDREGMIDPEGEEGERMNGGEDGEGEADGRKGTSMTDVDMRVLLRHLSRDRGVVVVDERGGGIVKFIQPFASKQSREINAVDRGILELKTAVENLEKQVEGLRARCDEYTRRASSALKSNAKPLALSHLRARSQLESLLKRRLGALENLEGTLMQVEGAAGDVEILSQYKSSTATLKMILSNPALSIHGPGGIQETMEAMEDARADKEEVDEIVRSYQTPTSGEEEEELEEELRRLVEEQKAEEDARRKEKETEAESRFPDAPTHRVTVERESKIAQAQPVHAA